MGSHDVCLSFCSIIHTHSLIKLYKYGVSTCNIRTLYDMYTHVIDKIKLPDLTTTEIAMTVSPGMRYGALTFPLAIDNCFLDAQSQVVTSCILEGIDVSFIAYADDLFISCRTVLVFEKHFVL